MILKEKIETHTMFSTFYLKGKEMKWMVRGRMAGGEWRNVKIVIMYLCSLVVQKKRESNENNI